MRFLASVVALGLGTLACTPCLALTVQAAPPRPDVAQHLRSTSPPAFSVLPAPDDLRGSFVAPGRPLLELRSGSPSSGGTTSFSVGPLRATTTVAPSYGGFWNEPRQRDSGNPLSLSPRRP